MYPPASVTKALIARRQPGLFRLAVGIALFGITGILALVLAWYGFPPLFNLAQEGVVSGGGLFAISPEIARTLAEAGISQRFLAMAIYSSRLIGWLTYVVTGLVIYFIRPRDRAATVTAIMLVSVGTALLTPLALAVELRPELAPAVAVMGHAAAPWAEFGRSIAGLSTLLAMLVLPDGQFVPRWARWLALVVVAIVALWVLFPNSIFAITNWPAALQPVWIGGVPLAGALAQIYRYARVSTPEDRRKTRTVIAAVVVAAAAFLGLVVLSPELGEGLFDLGVVTPEVVAFYEIILVTLLGASVLVLPVSVAWSVMRHRLFDVRVLATRALVYAVVAALMVSLGLAAVFVLSRALGLLLGEVIGADVALVASTIAITLLFGPARRWVAGLIDRAFYRRRYDSAQILEDFGQRLVKMGSLDNCSAELSDVVQRTMQPRLIKLWVRPTETEAEA